MLCDACETLRSIPRTNRSGEWIGVRPFLFEDVLTQDIWAGAHHVGEGEFLSAVRKKCYICNTIFRDLSPELQEQASLFHTFFRLRLVDAHDGSQHYEEQFELEFTIEMRSCQLPLANQRVYECTGTFKILPKSKIIDFEGALGLTKDTFTDKCKEQVRQWLNTCTHQHDKCNRDGRTHQGTPARLLHILCDGRFRLQTFAQNTQCPLYVTLSHCWEVKMPVKLLGQTLENLQHGMPVSSLPKRFEEAIKIARWMEIDYIWIDALCIMQDSKEDWLHQSARMGDIYAKSYCNIAATLAGPDRGCFTSRVTSMVEPYAVQNPCSEDPTATHFVGYDDFWSNSLLDSHVHNRGWVLQERLLSPRTIHFGQEQIFWECRQEMACEAYPKKIPADFCNHKTRTWRKFDAILDLEHKPTQLQRIWKYCLSYIWPVAPVPDHSQLLKAYEIWSKTVERYMECRLSVSDDKLVAISGIAQKIAKVTKEPYLAGLWDNSMLACGLLWYVLRRRQADGIQSLRTASAGEPGYRAPSWSWASLEAKVIWPWPVSCNSILIDVVNKHVEELPGSSMGGVASAVMQLRGKLIQGDLRILNHSADGIPDEDGCYEFQLATTSFQQSEPKSSEVKGATIEPVVYLDTPLLPLSSNVEAYLLPVCTGWKGRPGSIITSLAGLLLRSTIQSDGSTLYQRIGIFGLNQAQVKVVCGLPLEIVERRDESSTCDWQTLVTLV